MLDGPLAPKLSQRLLCDLERNRSDLIVVDGLTLANTPRANPVLKWFEENYRPFSKTDKFFVPIGHPPDVILTKDQFLLFALKGGKLDAQNPGAGNETAKSLPVVGIF